MCSYRNSHAVNMLEEIKVKRERMIDSANKSGFTSEETIKVSQELDELINEYQRTFSFSSKSNEEGKIDIKKMILMWSKSIAEI